MQSQLRLKAMKESVILPNYELLVIVFDRSKFYR